MFVVLPTGTIHSSWRHWFGGNASSPCFPAAQHCHQVQSTEADDSGLVIISVHLAFLPHNTATQHHPHILVHAGYMIM
jgi:hypothetical protein